MLSIVLAEADVLLRGFGRSDPDPAVVQGLTQLIQQRRLFMIGWVRQGLLTRCSDDRAFRRLAWVLSAFPDIPITSADHMQAAVQSRWIRERGGSIQPAQSLLWAMSQRIGAEIYTRERRWLALEHLGAPIFKVPVAET